MAMTEEQIKRNDHISTATIKRDLLDTEAEIKEYEAELTFYIGDRKKHRIEIMKTEKNLRESREFVSMLKEILVYRGVCG